MSRLIFEDHDTDNHPAIIDATTGRVLPDDHPAVKLAAQLYRNETTLAERRAWHAVTCLNSRTPEDLRLYSHVVEIIKPAMALMSCPTQSQ